MLDTLYIIDSVLFTHFSYKNYNNNFFTCVEIEQDHLKFLRIVRLQFFPRWYGYVLLFLAEEKIYELESQFGELVQGIHEDLQNDKQKLSQLPVIIRYRLPQCLKGIKDHIPYESN